MKIISISTKSYSSTKNPRSDKLLRIYRIANKEGLRNFIAGQLSTGGEKIHPTVPEFLNVYELYF